MFSEDTVMQYIIESENRIAYAYYLSESDIAQTPKEENVLSKAINALKAAIQTLIEKIKEILSGVGNAIFSTGFDSPEQKAKYEKLKEFIKNNPEYGNVKVTVRDFKEYEKVYDKYLNNIEKECAKDTKVDKSWVDRQLQGMEKEIKNITDKYKGAASRTAGVIALNRAIAIADRNSLAAKMLKSAIEDEEKALETFGKALNEKELKKAKKKISRYANNGVFHRAKNFILRRKKDTLLDIAKETGDMVNDFVSFDADGKLKIHGLKGALKHPILTAKIAFGKNAEGNRPILDAGLYTKKHKREAEDAAQFFGVNALMDKIRNSGGKKK